MDLSRRATLILKTFFLCLKKVVNLTTTFWELFCRLRGGHGPLKNRGIRAGGYFGGHFGFSKLLLGASAGPRGPPRRRENVPSSLLRSALASRNRTPSFLQGIMPPRGCLHCKHAAIRAVARDPENRVIRACGHLGGTLGRPRSFKNHFLRSL